MKLTKVTIGDRDFYVRPETSDLKAIEESYLKGYQRKGFYETGDVWIDGGANAGGFTAMAAQKVKAVHSFEPDRQNWLVLRENTKQYQNVTLYEQGLGHFARNTIIYRNTKKGNVWRNSIVKNWRNSEQAVVNIVALDDVLKQTGANGLKLDIEGAEFEILENCILEGINKLVFEYSFDIDGNLERYRKIIERIESLGFDVMNKRLYSDHRVWPKSWFPPCQTIWCTKTI